MFQRTGLDMASLEPAILGDCSNGGDFLRIFMEAMARQQGVERWAETTPEHIYIWNEFGRRFQTLS